MRYKNILRASITSIFALFCFITPTSAQSIGITINPSSGFPGERVHLTGSGFTRFTPCDINFGDLGTVVSFEADANGGVDTYFTVPNQAPFGAAVVLVTCSRSMEQTRAIFTVVQPHTPTCEELRNCTPTPVPAVKTCQELQNCTPTPGADSASTTNTADYSPTPNSNANPIPTPIKWFRPPTSIQVPPPSFNLILEMIPTGEWIGIGLWFLSLLGFFSLWRVSRRKPNSTERWVWGVATLTILLIGFAVLAYAVVFPDTLVSIGCIIGKPDLTITNMEIKKDDIIYVTIVNKGTCFSTDSCGELMCAPEASSVKKGLLNEYLACGFPIPSIPSGGTYVYTEEWYTSYQLWHDDVYHFGAAVNISRKIKEENYYNNYFIMTKP